MISLLVIFISCFVLAGCNVPANDRTDVYGTLVYDNPDSLLQVVTNVDTTGMSTWDRQEYNLMYTAAMCRTGLCISDTAVISACEKFFSEEGDKNLTALSKLYHAENAYSQFDYYKAVKKAMEALNVLQDTDNDALKYSLFNLLYRINSETECSERAEFTCRKAVEYAESGGMENQIADARNNLAAMLIGQGKMDEAARILKGGCPTTDKRILSEYYRIRGVYLLEKDSIGAAHDVLKKAEKIMPTAETFYDIALVYLKTGNDNQCLNYCHSATTADSRGYISLKAYNIIVENFSNQLNINTLVRICMDINKLYLKRAEPANVIKIEAVQAAYDKEDDGGIGWGVVAIVVLLSAVAGVFLIRRRDTVRENRDAEGGDMKLMNEQIVYDLHKLCVQGRCPSQEQWIDLHSAANRNIPFFLERLHKINDLSAREINVCILTRLHFSPSEIATLVEVSPQSVTNIRARLLTKIFGVKGGAAEFDRRIVSMK